MKKKYIKTSIVIFIGCLFIVLIGVVVMKDIGHEMPYVARVEENRLKMTGVEMVYIFNESGYMNLRSNVAFVDRASNAVSLDNVSVKYSGKNINLDANADKGIYKLQRVLKVSGNVVGRMNDMGFKAGERGSLTYDYKDGKGRIEHGIIMNQGQNSITAGRADFDVNNNYVLFSDNVKVEYFVSLPKNHLR